MSIQRDYQAESDALKMPFEDYLKITCEPDSDIYGVEFKRTRISRKSAIRQYRAILKALMEIEQEDIKEGLI